MTDPIFDHAPETDPAAAALAQALEAVGCEASCGDCGAAIAYHAECDEGDGLLTWDVPAAALAATPAMAALLGEAAIGRVARERCPDCGLTGIEIGRIHINAQQNSTEHREAALLREAEVGRAVERLPRDAEWHIGYGNDAYLVIVYEGYDGVERRRGTGPTLPAAIAAALGEEQTDE